MSCSCDNSIIIYKGDTATLFLSIQLSDDTLMDFKDSTVKFIVKKSKEELDSQAIVLKEYSPTESTTEITINLSENETNVTAGSYFYGVRVLKESSQITEGEGIIVIKQGVFYGE